jgi:hypothetical protein
MTYQDKVNASKRWHPHLGVNKRRAGKRRGKRYWSQLDHKTVIVEQPEPLTLKFGVRGTFRPEPTSAPIVETAAQTS